MGFPILIRCHLYIESGHWIKPRQNTLSPPFPNTFIFWYLQSYACTLWSLTTNSPPEIHNPQYYEAPSWLGEVGVLVSWQGTLQWCHNQRDGVPNHQPHDCLLNRLFRYRSKKHQSSAPLNFVSGIHRWPMKSLHKGPVTQNKFPNIWRHHGAVQTLFALG